MSENITSKYFTPSQYLESKLPKNTFSMIHINIASLSKHIEELRSLLSVLNHPFGIIGITETRIHDETPPVNVDIEGYEFMHTPTSTPCGGAGMYIKSCHNFEVVKNLTKSNDDVSESLFIEIKRDGHKNLIIGRIYTHHSPIPTFLKDILQNALEYINKQSSKNICINGEF